ncbi:hypothetical protein CEXT_29591 [Caerostris extrusa]|uniref:Uncharacterized protein n=1 Tax=Caerostris extrusa TaxID=172846 RepID=A0AAV4NDY8_CAEEX|nr:hypothetical protein CEXT_29591 [Caerostris extrusa]
MWASLDEFPIVSYCMSGKRNRSSKSNNISNQVECRRNEKLDYCDKLLPKCLIQGLQGDVVKIVEYTEEEEAEGHLDLAALQL